MCVGVLTLTLYIPGCSSLKEKRQRLKPILARLHREFNISTAELDQMDVWQSAVIGCALLSNDPSHTQRSLQEVIVWVENYWRDVTIEEQHIEIM